MLNIHREPLGGGFEIYVSKSYHFSTDTILLANFADRKGGRLRVDLGSGCGTIALLWLKDNKNLDVAAVEIQQDQGMRPSVRSTISVRRRQSCCSSEVGSAFASGLKDCPT